MADLIIKGGSVITMNGPVIENGVVVVDKGIITYAGKDTKEKADKIIDAKGCAVLPGLINAHTHLPMTLFRGFADDLPYNKWIGKIQNAEMELTPADVKTGAYLGILEMIRSGTTSFADMYFYMDEVAQAVKETGMRAALGYGIIEGINEDPETKLKNRADFFRKWNGEANGRITTMYAPHSTVSCSKEILVKVKEMAREDNAGIHIHILETESELKLMKKQYGMCSVNLLDSIDLLGPDILAAHCVWLSEDDIEILKNKNVNVAHCPSSNIALGAGVAPVPEMMEKGINVALGTDGAASGRGLNMWEEMRTASSLHKIKDTKNMPASTLLKMATVNGTKALNTDAGVLKPGALADIIIVDLKKPQFTTLNLLSALVHGTCDVRTTIVNGEILMEDYGVAALDEEKVIENAQAAISGIV